MIYNLAQKHYELKIVVSYQDDQNVEESDGT